MEQQLINELISLIIKMGGKAMIKDLIRETDTDGDPRHWTPEELKKAVAYVKRQNTYFGTADALAIVEILEKTYYLMSEEV